MELDIALAFHQIPVTPAPCFREDVQTELEGLVSGSNLSQPHLIGSNCRCRSACRTVFLQVTRKRMERPDDTAAALQSVLEARKVVSHSSVDFVALISIRRVGFSAQSLPALFVLWRDLSAFWSAREKLDVLTRQDRNRSLTSLQTAWSKRNFFEMWRLAYRLSGRLGTSRGRRLGFSGVRIMLRCYNERDTFTSEKRYHLGRFLWNSGEHWSGPTGGVDANAWRV